MYLWSFSDYVGPQLVCEPSVNLSALSEHVELSKILWTFGETVGPRSVCTERKNDTPDGVVTYLSKTTPRRGSRGESLRKFFLGVFELPQGGVVPKRGVTDDIWRESPQG